MNRTDDLKGGCMMKINQKLMIFYMDSGNNVTQRIIRIINMTDDAIVAYYYYRKRVRTFKLSNILSDKRVGA